jgi:hypothetical protein
VAMQRSKWVFLIIALIFLVIVALVVIDFSRKTTFPGRHSSVNSAIHGNFSKKIVCVLVGSKDGDTLVSD